LMAEALSFAIQAEFPITVILSQRAGPSTWTPTYHETWDINFALNPTFWDFDHIVLCPSSLEEAYNFAWMALNLADKYQSVVILLVDKQLSELSWTYSSLEKIKVDRWLILDNPPEDYKRYKLTEDWISPRVIVGTKNWDFIRSSYEHDEYWATTEDANIKKLMTEKRWKKLKDFFKKEGITWFEVINENAKKMILTFSFTSYTAKEFIKNNPQYWLVIIKFLKPLDVRLLDFLKDKEEIVFVENNYSGQLENYICGYFGLRFIKWLKISSLRKYDLYPFYIEDFNSLIWK
jgi:2-oxoglutarate ferredoxin oxidoreductase subunit alpha